MMEPDTWRQVHSSKKREARYSKYLFLLTVMIHAIHTIYWSYPFLVTSIYVYMRI